jgi:DUF3060 family protein
MYPGGDDPERRIAELERELSEQKRINDLQNQLVDARAATPGPVYFRQSSRPSRGYGGANLFGAIAGIIGFCAGGGAALIAALPSSALWTSRIICGAPNQLMVNTSHYSYKPNQSGTTVDFECLKADGVYDANWLAISALQSVLVAVVLAGVAAVVLVLRRRSRGEPVSPPMMVLAGALAVATAVVVGFVASQVFSGSSRPIQLPPGGSLSVDGNAQTKNIACNDGHVKVDGREMTVTISGHCASITVDGVINKVSVDSADTVDIDGIHNVVTYHSGSPKVTNRNGLNTVAQG